MEHLQHGKLVQMSCLTRHYDVFPAVHSSASFLSNPSTSEEVVTIGLILSCLLSRVVEKAI